MEMAYDVCSTIIDSEAIHTILADKEPFDVIIMEHFNTDCLMAIAWKLKAPVIGASSCSLLPWHHDRVASPAMASYVPSLFSGYSYSMSFTERISNWFEVHLINLMYR